MRKRDFKGWEIVRSVVRHKKRCLCKALGISLAKLTRKDLSALALTATGCTAHIFLRTISLALPQWTTQITWCQCFSGSVKKRQQCKFFCTYGWSQQSPHSKGKLSITLSWWRNKWLCKTSVPPLLWSSNATWWCLFEALSALYGHTLRIKRAEFCPVSSKISTGMEIPAVLVAIECI